MKNYMLQTIIFSTSLLTLLLSQIYLIICKNNLRPYEIFWNCVINIFVILLLSITWIIDIHNRKKDEEYYRQESEDVRSILREISPAIIKGRTVAGTVYANPVREPTGLGWIN